MKKKKLTEINRIMQLIDSTHVYNYNLTLIVITSLLIARKYIILHLNQKTKLTKLTRM